MQRNELYPVFFRMDRLRTLIVGGGNVGLEKLTFLLKSSPNAQVIVESIDFLPQTEELIAKHDSVHKVQKAFEPSDLDAFDLVIAATADNDTNRHIWEQAKQRGIIINVADTPELCDFYLGSIVTRGPLKLAISTNGQSPTFAKRIRQMMEDVLPDEKDIDEVIENLRTYRDTLKGDFEEKVEKLNKITEVMIEK